MYLRPNLLLNGLGGNGNFSIDNDEIHENCVLENDVIFYTFIISSLIEFDQRRRENFAFAIIKCSFMQ